MTPLKNILKSFELIDWILFILLLIVVIGSYIANHRIKQQKRLTPEQYDKLLNYEIHSDSNTVNSIMFN